MRTLLSIIGIILGVLLFGSYVPDYVQSFSYGLSLFIKNILIFILPIIIFSFIFNSVINLKTRAIGLLLLLIVLVSVSNFLSTWLAYFVYSVVKPSFKLDLKQLEPINALQPYFSVALPKIFKNDIALLSGAVLGFLSLQFFPRMGEQISGRLVYGVLLFLNRIFVPIIPVFIAGFIFKLSFDKQIIPLLTNYLWIFLMIITSVYSYLIFLYIFVLRKFAVNFLLDMAPSMLVGFGAMSSAAALPSLSLVCEKETNEPSVIRAMLPPTTNFHLIGDCFAIPIMALGIMASMGYPLPSIGEYLIFSGYFIVYKFAVAAVPGGGILIMLPILQNILGFTSDMLSLITMLYILFDSFITMANVMGNGVFSVLFTKIYKRFFGLVFPG